MEKLSSPEAQVTAACYLSSWVRSDQISRGLRKFCGRLNISDSQLTQVIKSRKKRVKTTTPETKGFT